MDPRVISLISFPLLLYYCWLNASFFQRFLRIGNIDFRFEACIINEYRIVLGSEQEKGFRRHSLSFRTVEQEAIVRDLPHKTYY